MRAAGARETGALERRVRAIAVGRAHQCELQAFEVGAVKLAVLDALAIHEHPLVLPQVSHLRQVPFLTSVKLPQEPQASPS